MSLQSIPAEYVISPVPQNLSSRLGSETVVLNLQSGVYFGLNEVGARVWELSQAEPTVRSLYHQLIDEFDVEAGVLQRDLSVLLERMQAEGLIRISAVS